MTAKSLEASMQDSIVSSRVHRLHTTFQRGPLLKENPSKWIVWRSRLLGFLGRVANWLNMPGFVSEVQFQDELTGQQISIAHRAYFTIVSVDGRDYYFRRMTGKFDGTGYQTKC